MLVKQFDIRYCTHRGYMLTPVTESNRLNLVDEGFYFNLWNYDGFLTHCFNGDRDAMTAYEEKYLGIFKYTYSL